MDPLASVELAFRESIRVKEESLPAIASAIVRAAELMAAALGEGKKVLCCGNGGSAADAQHFSGELLNRFLVERPALPAIALTAEACTITAIANDYHYDQIFAKQVRALGQPGDVLLAISTSGSSANVVNAAHAAHERSMPSVLLTGRDGGALAVIAGNRDVEIRVGSRSTPRIQEVHILVLHCLCQLIDERLFPNAREG